MKTLTIFCWLILSASYSFTQGVAINNDAAPPDNSAILDIKSNVKGFLPPRMSTAQRMAIPSPANGLIVYDTDTKNLTINKTTEGWIEQSPFNIPYAKSADIPFGSNLNLINSSNFFNSTAIRGSAGHTGIWGSGTSVTSRGVFGEGTVPNAVGIWGKAFETVSYPVIDYNTAIAGQAAANIGIAGYATTGTGIKGKATGVGGRGGFFEGLSGAKALMVAGPIQADGEVTVNGNSQVNGILEINGVTKADGGLELNGDLTVLGNAGTIGQILTSGGPGTAPVWRTASYQNSTRFQATVLFTHSSTSYSYTQEYNLTPADITITSTGITVNKTGLYHLEVYVRGYKDYSTAPSSPPVFIFGVLGTEIIKPYHKDNLHYSCAEVLHVDEYLTAGRSLQFRGSTVSDGISYPLTTPFYAKITGNLISE